MGTVPPPLAAFVPRPDVRERFEVIVQAPPEVMFAVCSAFDIQTLFVVRAIFWLRARLLRSTESPSWDSQGFLTDAQAMGWGVLAEDPPYLFVGGASCQPWLPDVIFAPLTATSFGPFDEPNRVKIAWTLEIEPLGDARCRLGTETRAVATDAEGRRRFLRYWRWARLGIVSIRLLLLPAMRRRAEQQFRVSGPGRKVM